MGHPNFVYAVPKVNGQKIGYNPDALNNVGGSHLPLNGGNSDFDRANLWAENKFGITNFQSNGSTGCKIYDLTSPYKNAQGWVECVWHHHEDAKTLIPVQAVEHNRGAANGSSHTGGARILKTPPNKPDLSELIGFFDSPTVLTLNP